MLGLNISDATAGFRAFRAGCLGDLKPESCEASGYGFQVEMVMRASDQGLTITELPITFTDRRAGSSKMSAGIVAEAMALVTRWGIRRRLSRN